ncbi:MAG: glycoside hydrolase family 13 protein [Clostridia bacterium]|nr:glycoside hydrolase family 13 protein [Clostridia bacterium]
MVLFHNSQDTKYRSPFGAVSTKTRVRLCLDVVSEAEPSLVQLRVWHSDREIFYPMEVEEKYDDRFVYSIELSMPSQPCLFWYSFVADCGGERVWYINNPERLGGIGEMSGGENGRSFQITVYEKGFETPKWFRGQIMYQIFPDRFFGERENGEIFKKRDEYIIHYDLGEEMSFNRHPYEDGPAYNDFYGGNLKGIIKKLPYIKSLGVGVIYLNPIFDAYSNHKYDTANYKEIDPMFGNEDDFARLCSEAKKLGIRIILDGVFSHTGADSIYFNKYKSYGGGGAYNDASSPYRSWYSIDGNGNYESWWGCSNLPNVNELDDSYLDYILRDEDSVIKKWLRLGASGWRLDVADELPDEFIKILRQEVKKVNPDAVIIGEVWEDASNKVAYGKQREYLLGGELDSVMNYIFRDNVTAFLMGEKSARELCRSFMSVMENYPAEVSYSLMNLIGTHDTMRIKSLFGGMREDCRGERLTSGMESLSAYRLMCAAFIQMTYPGVPSVYYGDEIGMQGGRDPYNRAPFTWRAVDMELLERFRYLGSLRNRLGVLKNGFFKVLYADDDVLVYARYFKDNKDVFGAYAGDGFALCAVNRSFEERKVTVDLSEFDVSDLMSDDGSPMQQSGGGLEFGINPLGTKLFYEVGKFAKEII